MDLPFWNLWKAKCLIDGAISSLNDGLIFDDLRLQNQERIGGFKSGAPTDGRSVITLDQLVGEGQRFGSVYADPPWRYENRASRGAAENHYDTMSVDAIASLPVAKLVAEQAHLHLWTTNAFLFEAIKVIEAWGFSYKSCLIWIKPQFGNGNYWRLSHEFLLLGVRGSLTFSDNAQQSWLVAERTKHSAKPRVFRRLIESVSPGPRLELFARNQAEGWTTWGNEIQPDLFDSVL